MSARWQRVAATGRALLGFAAAAAADVPSEWNGTYKPDAAGLVMETSRGANCSMAGWAVALRRGDGQAVEIITYQNLDHRYDDRPNFRCWNLQAYRPAK